MNGTRLRLALLPLLALPAACDFPTHEIVTGELDAGEDASSLEPDSGGPDPACGDPNNVPPTLACTGLYVDIGTKQLATGVHAFAPAVPFWSDGAEKSRWIYLPEGTQIDITDRSEWTFPVGTKLWKEFKRAGRRVETRLFQKVRSDRWIRGTYVWSADESAADFNFGGRDIEGPDGPYYLPSQSQCDECHEGRRDRILGFEEISLGTAGATGLTLPVLAEQGLLSPAPASTEIVIPDDGTGKAPPALAWLHVNCGVSCHNGGPNATAGSTGLRMRLLAQEFGSVPPSEWDVLKTTLGVAVVTPQWAAPGAQRIIPGDPDNSTIVHLVGTRGEGEQMPPIATREIDQQGLALVREWIAAMAAGQPDDAGAPDTGVPNAPDAGTPSDAGGLDASQPDAGTPDDAAVDAEAPAFDAGGDGGA